MMICDLVAPDRTRAALSTLHEWLADKRGSALLHERFGDLGVLHDPALLAVIGTMPMDTLAGFPGMGLDHDQLDTLLSELGSTG